MENPRSEKVAVVDEVREKLSAADGVVLTEYRGLNVSAMAELRRALRDAGGEYKIYKNTLIRIAARDAGLEIDDLLTGPTAIAFVNGTEEGQAGDPAAVAKALREFATKNDALVLKGGLLNDKVLSAEDVAALAALPSRDVLLAQLAGAFQAPMAKLAGLLSALPRNFAYGLQALIDAGGASDAPVAETAEVADEATEADTESAEAPADAADTESDAGESDAGDDNSEEEE